MSTLDEKKFNEALKRALNTPPQPHKPLGKKKAAKKKAAKKNATARPKDKDANR